MYVQTLVRQLGEDLCFQPDKDGNIPLHLAAGIGNMAAVDGGLLNGELWGGVEGEEEEKGEGDEGEGEEEEVAKVKTKEEVQCTCTFHYA